MNYVPIDGVRRTSRDNRNATLGGSYQEYKTDDVQQMQSLRKKNPLLLLLAGIAWVILQCCRLLIYVVIYVFIIIEVLAAWFRMTLALVVGDESLQH